MIERPLVFAFADRRLSVYDPSLLDRRFLFVIAHCGVRPFDASLLVISPFFAVSVTSGHFETSSSAVQMVSDLFATENVFAVSNLENVADVAKLHPLGDPSCCCGRVASLGFSDDMIDSVNDYQALICWMRMYVIVSADKFGVFRHRFHLGACNESPALTSPLVYSSSAKRPPPHHIDRLIRPQRKKELNADRYLTALLKLPAMGYSFWNRR